jgi:Tachylectin
MTTIEFSRRELCVGAAGGLLLLKAGPAPAQGLTSGVIYGIKPDGGIYWYRHEGRGDGTGRWSNGGNGLQVGTGWDMYSQVISGGDGVIYGIKPDGGIYWYRHEGRGDGTGRWSNRGTGLDVGTGWDMYSQVISGGDGVIYGIKPDGGIYWYRHEGRGDGTGRWSNRGNGLQVGTGWDMYSRIISGGDGVIYGIKPDGGIYWYRHEGRGDGTGRWSNGGNGLQVGTGWDMYSQVISGGAGVIYGIKPDGGIYWYRHEGRGDGTGRWSNRGNGLDVGTGWDMYSRILGG